METINKQGERVRTNTSEKLNRRVDEEIIGSLRYYAANPAAIGRRIRELDREWDIERTLELNAAAFALAGTVLGAFANRKWFILPAVVTTFLMQHAIQGWCPPLPLFRRLGIRTRPEIDREKYALKALRGDFMSADEPARAWTAVSQPG